MSIIQAYDSIKSAGLTLVEKRKLFNEQLNNVFNTASDGANKNWSNEFFTISDFILRFPKEQQSELFLYVCEKYLTIRSVNYNYSNSNYYKTALSMSNPSFLDFVSNPKFKKFADTILQNVFKSEIYKIIDSAIDLENLHEAKDFITLFLREENKHLQNFNHYGTLNNIINNNRRHSLNFLIENFEGWEKTEYLQPILFKTSLDDHLLDKILSKSGLINDSNNDLINTIINRDIPSLRKIEILNKIVAFETPNTHIINFYNTEISKNNISIVKLENMEDKFLKQINDNDYIKSWLNKDLNGFINNIEILLKNNFINDTTLRNNVYDYFDNLVINDHTSNPNQLNILISKSKLDFNDPKTQKVIIKLTSVDTLKEYYTPLLYNNNNINKDIALTVNENDSYPYKTLNDFLKEKDHIIYNLSNFANVKKDQKEKAYQKILHQLDSIHYTYQSILSPEHEKMLYDYAKSIKNPNEFFTEHFINITYRKTCLKESLMLKYIEYYKKEDQTLVFNLPENNPIHNFLKNHCTDNLFNATYCNLLYNLNDYFEHKLNYTENKDGVTVMNYANQINCSSHYFTQNEKQVKSKKGFLKWFGSSETIFQVVKTLQGCELITDINKKVEINLNANNNSSIENINSFDSLIEQATLDLNNLHKLLDSHADKNLHIEVKIRADNILLNNLNFLNTVKDSNEDIAFDDMHFLKSNLNKYLFQSLNVYAKSVSRYEALSDPSNKLNTKSEEELERQKEKIDNEALKQIGLLEKELELVKEHIVHQINRDLLTDMKVTTRVLEHRVEESEGRSSPDEGRVISIRKQ